jgi:hypothetical protein
MFFYVFIDPEAITEAAQSEKDLSHLIDLLLKFELGFLMVETDSYRVGEELGERIKSISGPDESLYGDCRKKLGELVIHLWKKTPLVYVDGDDGSSPLLDVILTKAEESQIDIILTSSEKAQQAESSCEICTASDFFRTQASQAHQNLSGGKDYDENQDSHEEFFQFCLAKLVYHADQITIIDYSLGEHYGNDQPLNLRRWVLWINQHILEPERKKLIIKTVSNRNFNSLKRQIEGLDQEVDLSIELLPDLTKRDVFHHHRYLIAGRNALNIDRGIDWFFHDGRTRGGRISYTKLPR